MHLLPASTSCNTTYSLSLRPLCSAPVVPTAAAAAAPTATRVQVSRGVSLAAATKGHISTHESHIPEAEKLSAQTTPVDLQAVKQRLSECPICGGTGRVTCKGCNGQGLLPRGGYSKKNPLNISRIIGSKWTAMTETLGWRHFRVTAVRRLDKKGKSHDMFMLLQASCDHSCQLWVNAQTLRNRSCWAAGWLQMKELTDEGVGVPAGSGHKCHSCAGLGFRACPTCDGRGRALLVEL